MRESGYYWVKSEYNGWMVAEWSGGMGWYLTGNSTFLPETEWEEINENKIQRQ